MSKVIEDADNSRVDTVIEERIIGQRIIGLTVEAPQITVSLENGCDLLFEVTVGDFSIGVRKPQ